MDNPAEKDKYSLLYRAVSSAFQQLKVCRVYVRMTVPDRISASLHGLSALLSAELLLARRSVIHNFCRAGDNRTDLEWL